MIYDPQVETRDPAEQYRIDAIQYRRQVEYLFAHSEFYRQRLSAAGFKEGRLKTNASTKVTL
jgi:phenylacetate-coenzyme A ligase PaaK-like adenylate-forming protein